MEKAHARRGTCDVVIALASGGGEFMRASGTCSDQDMGVWNKVGRESRMRVCIVPCSRVCMHVQMWYREQRLLDKKDKKESSVIFVDKGPSVAWESLVLAAASLSTR